MSRNDQAQAGHEGESEAKKASCITQELSGLFREPQMPRMNEAWWRERSDDGVFLLIQSVAVFKGARRTTQAGRPG